MAEYIDREAAISAILSAPTDAHYPAYYASIIMRVETANINRGSEFCPNCGARKDGDSDAAD